MIKWHVLCTGNVKFASSVHFRKVYIWRSVLTYVCRYDDAVCACTNRHTRTCAHKHTVYFKVSHADA